MWLGGNPDDIRRHAVRLRGLADTVAAERALAQQRLAGVQWESAAAASFRAQSTVDFGVYDRAINQIHDAAHALDHLANELAERQRALIDIAAEVGRTAEELWNEAKNMGEDVLSYANNVLDDIGRTVTSGLSKGKHVLDDLTGGIL